MFNSAIGKKHWYLSVLKLIIYAIFFIVNIRVRITVSKYKLLITWKLKTGWINNMEIKERCKIPHKFSTVCLLTFYLLFFYMLTDFFQYHKRKL